jgi:hypothetical protein
MTALALAVFFVIPAAHQEVAPQPKVSASQIMSKMFAHYADAKSAVGTVKMAQTADGVTVHTNTDLQFERPNLIFLHQARDGSRARQWFLTSDGREFSYDRPEDQVYGPDRFVEYVTQHNVTLTISEYLLASMKSMGDINPMLESAIASREWLKRLTGQWASLTYRGRSTVNGQEVDWISGKFRETAFAKASGEFEAFITDSGDFVRYVLHQQVTFKRLRKEPINITTIWDADIKLNVKTDPSLYKVLK